MQLLSGELNQITTLDAEVVSANMRSKLAERDVQLADMQLMVLELQYKLAKQAAKEKREEQTQAKSAVHKAQDARRDYLKSVADRLGIDGTWGYDPISGEVHAQTKQEG